MGSLFRSEPMVYLRVVVPVEVAHPFVDDLGRRGIMEFVDMNEDVQAFQKRHIQEIIAIDDVQRKLHAINGYLKSYEVPHEDDINFIHAPPVTSETIEAVMSTVSSYHKRLVNDFHVAQEFKRQLEYEVDFEHVLRSSQSFLGHQDEARAELRVQSQENVSVALLADIESARVGDVAFRFVAGTVNRNLRPVFERQVFLVSRGNAYTLFSDSEAERDLKDAFVIFFLGSQLERRITKLCQVMNVSIFLNPDDQGSIDAKRVECQFRQRELTETLQRTQHQLKQDLFGVASRTGEWKRVLRQGKAIYTALNKMAFNANTQVLSAEGWVPRTHEVLINDSLETALLAKGFSVRNSPAVVQEVDSGVHRRPAPTYFRTNKVTKAFQAIVDTYGIPRYQEINPTVFALVTFPFLFGVMYGDVFHGSLLFLFSLYLIIREDKIGLGPMNEFMSTCYHGRYLLVAMGFFATYAGFIYNDFTSMPIHLFPTTWTSDDGRRVSGAYPFGIDWQWGTAGNQLDFLNSVKMKLAVVLGVSQMVLGIILSFLNQLYFRDYISVFTEFIPQIIFMLSFFGYMVFTILYKASIDWYSVIAAAGKDENGNDYRNVPNLIATMIYMVLHMGAVDDEHRERLYDGQENVQVVLLVLAILAIPWMLLPKPLYLRWKHQRTMRPHLPTEMDDIDSSVYEALPQGDDHSKIIEHQHSDHGEEFEFGEVMVHQMIHTIEFVLGAVSNTASYLRLWALSLAHAQLAEVFFQKLFLGLMSTGPIGTVIGFAGFFGATFAVLLSMDVLECFLHALRLHWVEFQNKFYRADGMAFRPFHYLDLFSDD